MKTMRVGLAGCGFAGHIHSRSLILAKGSRLSREVIPELVAVADKSRDRALKTSKQYGWQNVETDWRELFKHDLNLIIVALPNNDHVEIVKRASQAGITVLLEKPISRTYEQALELWHSTKNDPNIRVGYVNRFVPAMQHAKMMIDRGDIGSIRMFRSVYLLNMRKPHGGPDWRFDEKLAGQGASDDLGSHHIDALNFLVGDIAHVQSESRIWDIPHAAPASNDDAINSLITTQSGAFGTLSASRTSPGHPLTGYIEIEGDKGALRIDRGYLNELFVRSEAGTLSQVNVRPTEYFAQLWAAPTVQGAHPFSWYDCFAFQMTEILRIAAKLPVEFVWSASLHDGLKAMTATEAMIASAKSHRQQKIQMPKKIHA